MLCPRCNGVKEIIVANFNSYSVFERCKMCKGTGEADWLDIVVCEKNSSFLFDEEEFSYFIKENEPNVDIFAVKAQMEELLSSSKYRYKIHHLKD
jgi:hypothetical protein